MPGLTSHFDINMNFWKVNPAFMNMAPFQEFIKTHGSTISSKAMWFVAFMCEIDTSNTYRNIPYELRIDTLLENSILEKKFYKENKAQLEDIIKEYCKLLETPAMRQLRIWNMKMDEKSMFMQDTTYNAQNFEMLEKMMASNLKIYGDYELILKKLAVEDGGTTKGGATESLSDTGEI